MALPKNVQRQLEQADAVQAQLAAQAERPDIVTDVSQLVVQPAPVEPPPPAPVPPQTPAAPQPPQDTTDWKNKALTLEGMLRTQVPELRTETVSLKSQNAQLMAQLEAMKAARPPEPPPKATVDPRDVEAFGESMMDMVQRYVTGAVAAAESKVAGMTSTLETRVQALERSVQAVGQKAEVTLEAQFWEHLKQLVPDYEAVNDTPGWKAWLAETDALTGVQRQGALNAAQQSRDPRRVAAIFSLYTKSLPPSPAAALASQVSPAPGGAGAAPTAAPAVQLISEKFINDFYRDMQRGKYRGREAEANRIEAAIHQAAAEGRVVR